MVPETPDVFGGCVVESRGVLGCTALLVPRCSVPGVSYAGDSDPPGPLQVLSGRIPPVGSRLRLVDIVRKSQLCLPVILHLKTNRVFSRAGLPSCPVSANQSDKLVRQWAMATPGVEP